MAIVAVIGGITLFVLSIFFQWVQASVLTLLGIAKIIVSGYAQDFNGYFIAYGILTTIFILFLLGAECFNSDTKGDWKCTFFPWGATIEEDINHPIQAFVGTVFAGAFLMGIEYVIGWIFMSYEYLTFLSVLLTVFSVIYLIRVIIDELS